MTLLKTKITSLIKSTILVAALGTGALGAATTTSQAMVLQNCDANGVGVKVTGQTTGRVIKFFLQPGQKKAFQTSRGEKWRFNLNPAGKDVQFSGQSGNAIKSIVRIAGNIEVTRGLKCNPKPKPEPQPDPDLGDEQGYQRHIQFCLRKYKSYNPENNSWTDFSGNQRQCDSPFID